VNLHAVLQGARGLVQGLRRGIIIGLGLLNFLDSIGISITASLDSPAASRWRSP
jgi:hypothetical protein